MVTRNVVFIHVYIGILTNKGDPMPITFLSVPISQVMTLDFESLYLPFRTRNPVINAKY